MTDDAPIRGHDQVLARTIELFRSVTPPGVAVELPAPSAQLLDLRFEEYVPGRSLTATVAVPQQFANAVGLLQGGFLAAMLDNLIGPLSYLTARGPTTTLDLTTHFLRPVVPGERLRLEAVVRKAGKTAIYLAADAYNGSNKLVATAVSTAQVLSIPT